MIEIPCTLRCDKCGTTASVVLKPALTFQGVSLGPSVFMPEGWTSDGCDLRCPRCNGAK